MHTSVLHSDLEIAYTSQVLPILQLNVSGELKFDLGIQDTTTQHDVCLSKPCHNPKNDTFNLPTNNGKQCTLAGENDEPDLYCTLPDPDTFSNYIHAVRTNADTLQGSTNCKARGTVFHPKGSCGLAKKCFSILYNCGYTVFYGPFNDPDTCNISVYNKYTGHCIRDDELNANSLTRFDESMTTGGRDTGWKVDPTLVDSDTANIFGTINKRYFFKDFMDQAYGTTPIESFLISIPEYLEADDTNSVYTTYLIQSSRVFAGIDIFYKRLYDGTLINDVAAHPTNVVSSKYGLHTSHELYDVLIDFLKVPNFNGEQLVLYVPMHILLDDAFDIKTLETYMNGFLGEANADNLPLDRQLRLNMGAVTFTSYTQFVWNIPQEKVVKRTISVNNLSRGSLATLLKQMNELKQTTNPDEIVLLTAPVAITCTISQWSRLCTLYYISFVHKTGNVKDTLCNNQTFLETCAKHTIQMSACITMINPTSAFYTQLLSNHCQQNIGSIGNMTEASLRECIITPTTTDPINCKCYNSRIDPSGRQNYKTAMCFDKSCDSETLRLILGDNWTGVCKRKGVCDEIDAWTEGDVGDPQIPPGRENEVNRERIKKYCNIDVDLNDFALYNKITLGIAICFSILLTAHVALVASVTLTILILVLLLIGSVVVSYYTSGLPACDGVKNRCYLDNERIWGDAGDHYIPIDFCNKGLNRDCDCDPEHPCPVGCICNGNFCVNSDNSERKIERTESKSGLTVPYIIVLSIILLLCLTWTGLAYVTHNGNKYLIGIGLLMSVLPFLAAGKLHMDKIEINVYAPCY